MPCYEKSRLLHQNTLITVGLVGPAGQGMKVSVVLLCRSYTLETYADLVYRLYGHGYVCYLCPSPSHRIAPLTCPALPDLLKLGKLAKTGFHCSNVNQRLFRLWIGLRHAVKRRQQSQPRCLQRSSRVVRSFGKGSCCLSYM